VCSSGYAATDTWNTRKLRTARGAQKKKRGYTGVFKRLRRNGHLEYQKAARGAKKKKRDIGVFKPLGARRRREVTLVCSSGYAATDTWTTRKLRTAQLRLSLLRLNPKKKPLCVRCDIDFACKTASLNTRSS
jgi:hypothetical protein